MIFYYGSFTYAVLAMLDWFRSSLGTVTDLTVSVLGDNRANTQTNFHIYLFQLLIKSAFVDLLKVKILHKECTVSWKLRVTSIACTINTTLISLL